MFKAKKIKNGEVYQVLDVYFDPQFNHTYFLIWENNGWRWRDSKNFIPPNVEIEEKRP